MKKYYICSDYIWTFAGECEQNAIEKTKVFCTQSKEKRATLWLFDYYPMWGCGNEPQYASPIFLPRKCADFVRTFISQDNESSCEIETDKEKLFKIFGGCFRCDD